MRTASCHRTSLASQAGSCQKQQAQQGVYRIGQQLRCRESDSDECANCELYPNIPTFARSKQPLSNGDGERHNFHREWSKIPNPFYFYLTSVSKMHQVPVTALVIAQVSLVSLSNQSVLLVLRLSSSDASAVTMLFSAYLQYVCH